MIFSRFGVPIRIVSYCGIHGGGKLVDCENPETGKRRFYFSHTLRADGGIAEIDSAIDSVDFRDIVGGELKLALSQAR